MFFAKVLIGKYKYLESDKNIKMPPMNEETKQRYDSVKGITKEWEVYIVYDNGKSYPEYLITYSQGSSSSELSSLPQSSTSLSISSSSQFSGYSSTSSSFSGYSGGYYKKKKHKKKYYNNYSSNWNNSYYYGKNSYYNKYY